MKNSTSLILLCLGCISPSILVSTVWIATFGQMFTLAEGVFNPITQVFTVITTIAGLFTYIFYHVEEWERKR